MPKTKMRPTTASMTRRYRRRFASDRLTVSSSLSPPTPFTVDGAFMVRSLLSRSDWPLARDLHGRDTGRSAIAVPRGGGSESVTGSLESRGSITWTQGDLAGPRECARRSSVISAPYRRKVSEHPPVGDAQDYLACRRFRASAVVRIDAAVVRSRSWSRSDYGLARRLHQARPP